MLMYAKLNKLNKKLDAKSYKYSLILSGKDDTRWETWSGDPKTVDAEGHVKTSSSNAVFSRVRYWSTTFGFYIDGTVSVRALIFIENAREIANLEFNFAQDWNYTNGASWSISGTSLAEGWNELYITQKMVPYGAGYIVGGQVLSMQIGVTATAAGNASVSFYGLTGGHQEKTRIAFTFDDAWTSQHSMAFPILKQYGFKGSIAVAPGIMGSPQPTYGDTMTLAQMQEMYDYGWDMCNHTFSHTRLGDLSMAAAIDEVNRCTDWLNANGFTRASDILIYPYGSYREDQVAEFQKMFRMARTFMQVGDQSGSLTAKNPLRVKNVHMYSDMTAQDVILYIDQAVAAKGSIVLSNHLLTASTPVDSYHYDRTKFIEVVQYIHSLSDAVEVVTMSEWADMVL